MPHEVVGERLGESLGGKRGQKIKKILVGRQEEDAGLIKWKGNQRTWTTVRSEDGEKWRSTENTWLPRTKQKKGSEDQAGGTHPKGFHRKKERAGESGGSPRDGGRRPLQGGGGMPGRETAFLDPETSHK